MCLQSDIYTNQRIRTQEARNMENKIRRFGDFTENTEAHYRLPNTTTMEHLMMRVAAEGAVLRMGDKVLVTDRAMKGFTAAVYEFIETPEETGLGHIECRLNLTAMSQEVFEDGGHAIEWAMLR